jgi:hypothetical protein
VLHEFPEHGDGSMRRRVKGQACSLKRHIAPSAQHSGRAGKSVWSDCDCVAKTFESANAAHRRIAKSPRAGMIPAVFAYCVATRDLLAVVVRALQKPCHRRSLAHFPASTEYCVLCT